MSASCESYRTTSGNPIHAMTTTAIVAPYVILSILVPSLLVYNLDHMAIPATRISVVQPYCTNTTYPIYGISDNANGTTICMFSEEQFMADLDKIRVRTVIDEIVQSVPLLDCLPAFGDMPNATVPRNTCPDYDKKVHRGIGGQKRRVVIFSILAQIPFVVVCTCIVCCYCAYGVCIGKNNSE